MGSVVFDAVNSLISHHAPQHDQHDVFREAQAPRAHRPDSHSEHNRASSRIEAHMEPEQRAPSSSAAPTSFTAQDTPREVYATSTAQGDEDRSAAQPPSSPLTARPVPPPSDTPTRDSGTPGPTIIEERSSRPRKIKVRDLEHIQSFANEDMSSFSEIRSRSRSRSRGAEEEGPQYEISEMKVEHIIEMVAGLLTKITTTNDRQHEHLHRQPPSGDASSHLNPQTTSVLAFHGKNVPSITILSYLSRINKYCPTSYEVFLSLLVYFDRMTERVNAGPIQSLREANEMSVRKHSASSDSIGSDAMAGVTATTTTTPSGTQQFTPPHSGGLEREKAAARGIPGTPHSRPSEPDSPSMSPSNMDAFNMSHFFVVDSFNIHRLVIAGVTCASKFFSDIFYTNSRYAKVGGLPLPELNHLELQFLLLNDFRLSVPVEEIEAYGTMLVEFYAREVVAQKQASEAMHARSLSESSSDSTHTVIAG
ncbi:uncharacterized protein RCC_04048 [Ramularia collo-cygni]|uniref:Cyclin-domain-containing protein n=1 Tax=Ramularia collo-cygni TaxID=112498 RepID=A0A2D3UVJ4_9PEZI|nr:uncharacterized protein RCC_04048 [Ramularia collo-cygni]CZT18205.1 uncharacterized protein RCC_04048 [Ramularia collo-cygni]